MGQNQNQGQNQGHQFPQFKPVEIQDKEIINSFTHGFKAMSCEYSFANLFTWREIYDLSWTIHQGRLIIHDGIEGYTLMPLGPAISPAELVELSRALVVSGKSGDLALVPSEYVDHHPDLKEHYTPVKNRNFDDYLYSTQALAELKGKKLHKKRNLVSQFHRQSPNAMIQRLTKPMRPLCLDLANHLYRQNKIISRTNAEEHLALKEAFDHFEPAGLDGIAILVDNLVRAFAVFSPLNDSTYDIHFEKSDHEFKGISQAINHETAVYLMDKCSQINREQDLGISGLRQAKLSYSPSRLLSTLTLKLKI